ncbi:MAG: hypothetical protein CL693_01110 [Cellvibrionaceae bacterium]|nr:hypothetical protein [Cellvibrionaceae bacterium]|tara:strand:- start:23770 stop:24384 length:615 start_codon:yes stop_codon:yes gene_type:complete
MKMLIFDDKNSLIKGLKKFGRTMVLVTCISNGLGEVFSLRGSAENIINAESSYSADFPLLTEGSYKVESTNDESDIDYESYALAITFEVKMKNSIQGIKVGNLSNLKNALSDYEILARVGNAADTKGLVREHITKVLDNESGLIESDDYPAGYYWVPIPHDPEALKDLKNTLSQESVFYAFPNGKGTIDKSNLMQGGGLSTLYS